MAPRRRRYLARFMTYIACPRVRFAWPSTPAGKSAQRRNASCPARPPGRMGLPACNLRRLEAPARADESTGGASGIRALQGIASSPLGSLNGQARVAPLQSWMPLCWNRRNRPCRARVLILWERRDRHRLGNAAPYAQLMLARNGRRSTVQIADVVPPRRDRIKNKMP